MIEAIPTVASLSQRLRDQILRDGPMTFRDWMQAALYDPSDGYYTSTDRIRWGREGDYRTSPERTSLFAATFARYFATLYNSLGQPSSWTIAESGAGDGSFAYGILTTLQTFFPDVFAATRYLIDEVSPDARTRATTRFRSFSNKIHFARLEEVEIERGVVFSNELLDAFPVHRLKKVAGQLCELLVDVTREERFVWLAGPLSTPELEEYFHVSGIELADNQVAEVNLEMRNWFQKVSKALSAGYVVTVDYGDDESRLFDPDSRPIGTLRGIREHQFIENVLDEPGQNDLTSSVNWSHVKKTGDEFGLRAVRFERLEKFVMSEGLLTQLQSQLDNCSDEAERIQLTTAAREMILPDGMAAYFQVLVQQKVQQKEKEQ